MVEVVKGHPVSQVFGVRLALGLGKVREWVCVVEEEEVELALRSKAVPAEAPRVNLRSGERGHSDGGWEE